MTRRPVVHLELHTGDLPRASAFYAQLCGWRPEPIDTAHGAYHALGRRRVGGGIVECGAARPLWLPYVEVDEIDAATDRARQLGASVLLGPREGPAGWRSVVATPAGGEIAFWQPKAMRRARVPSPSRDERSSSLTAAELRAHCYRMLGSAHDAEDALQEALLRAWRGLATLRGPQLAALVAVHDRDQRLPEGDRAPAQARAADRLRAARRPPRRPRRAARRIGVDRAATRTRELALDDALAGPEARYEQRESIELAFIAALQHLPARQRAVLILRDVLGFSAREVGRGARDDAGRRSTARCSGRTRPSTSGCPSAASRPPCARSATSASARSSTGSSPRGSAPTSTRSWRCSPTTPR